MSSVPTAATVVEEPQVAVDEADGLLRSVLKVAHDIDPVLVDENDLPLLQGGQRKSGHEGRLSSIMELTSKYMARLQRYNREIDTKLKDSMASSAHPPQTTAEPVGMADPITVDDDRDAKERQIDQEIARLESDSKAQLETMFKQMSHGPPTTTPI